MIFFIIIKPKKKNQSQFEKSLFSRIKIFTIIFKYIHSYIFYHTLIMTRDLQLDPSIFIPIIKKREKKEKEQKIISSIPYTQRLVHLHEKKNHISYNLTALLTYILVIIPNGTMLQRIVS